MRKILPLPGFRRSAILFVLAIVYLYPARLINAWPGDPLQGNSHDRALKTGKTSYVAGETITVRGSGFAPYENVTLQVLHTDGGAEPSMGHESWSTAAGADGTFTAAWKIQAEDPAGREFIFVANGSSGSKAQAAFTRVGVVATDKSQYEPGEMAHVKGGGFLPRELVTLQVTPVNDEPRDPVLETFTTVSDENGLIRAPSAVQPSYSADTFLKLTAEGTSSNVQALALMPNAFFRVTDQNGANDEPVQKDLTLMGRNDSEPSFLKIFWNWDDVDFTAQRGDACALFDTSGDGNIDLAVCGEVMNGPGYGTTNRSVLLSQLSVWTCGNSRADRCAQPTAQVRDIGQTNAGVLGSGNPLDVSGSLITSTDPFPTGDFSPFDTTLQVNIDRNFLNSVIPGAALVNVCSYPSIGSGANTDPSDCITTPGGGFLIIRKDAGDDTSTSFTFGVGPVPADQPGTVAVIGTGNSDPIGIEIGKIVTVTETVPQGWLFQHASCVLEDGSPTGIPGGTGVSGITIQSGLVTTCTFMNVPQTPALTVTKSASPSTYDHVGQLIHYSYDLTNTGNVALDGPFTVTDNKATVTCPSTSTLAPEDSLTCAAEYSIVQADLDAGWVTNTAIAHAKFGGQTVDSNQASATVDAIASPALSLSKSAKPETYNKAGDVIHYTYALKSTSNVTLSEPFTVTDDKVTVTCPAVGKLAPNDTLSCTGAYTVTQADLDTGSVTNIAAGHATLGGKAITSNQAQATVNAVQSPALSITKSANPVSYTRAGDVIEYSYVVKDTGNLTLSGPFTVTDDKAAVTCPATASLAPGESISCTASYKTSQADMNRGSVTNHATAAGTFGGKAVESNTAEATVHAVQSMVLSLAKSAKPTSYRKAGETIKYTYLLQNAGTVTLSGPFTVADDKTSATCPATPESLAPGEATTCTATYQVTQDDLDAGFLTNHATASAKFSSDTVTSSQASATVTAVQGEGIKLELAPESQVVAKGGIAAFTVTVGNTGNVTLKSVTVSDPLAPDCSRAIGTLLPGASQSYSCTAVATGDFTNVATAVGTPPTGKNVSTGDTAEVKVASDLVLSETVNPGMKRRFVWQITKSVDKTVAEVTGESASFNYTVKVNQTGFSDSDWVLTGKINIFNPNNFPIVGASVVGSTEGAASCSIAGGTEVTIPAGGSILLNYSCVMKGPAAGTHAVTASWDKAVHHTPNGQASASAGFDFNQAGTDNIESRHGSITVIDTLSGKAVSLGMVKGTAAQPYASATFAYSKSLPAISGCVDYVNTAKIVETGQTAVQSVRVCGQSTTDNGALSKGFWQNKNGQRIIRNFCGGTGGTSLLAFLHGLAPFQDLQAADCTGIAGYVYGVIKAARSAGPSMNAMLKAQMLATALDVYFSDPALGGNRIKAPGPVGAFAVDLTRICGKIGSSGDKATCGGNVQDTGLAFGGADTMAISNMLIHAAGQSNAGGSLWYGNVKAVQGLASNAFDAINNRVAPAP